ncbi:hypothetical protein AB0O21_39530, partial [Streptomyces sp. NPDC091371]
DRLIYQARLQARYGRSWRRKAPVEALMPLRLARIGVPLSQTAPEGLAAAGIEPALLPPVEQVEVGLAAGPMAPALEAPAVETVGPQVQDEGRPYVQAQAPEPVVTHAPPAFAVDPTAMPAAHNSAWFAAPLAPQAAYEGGYNPQYVEGLEPTPVMPPAGPEAEPAPRQEQEQLPIPAPRQEEEPEAAEDAGAPDEAEFAEAAYKVFRALVDEQNDFPTAEALDIHLSDGYGVTHPRSGSLLRRMIPAFKQRYQTDLENEHIA